MHSEEPLKFIVKSKKLRNDACVQADLCACSSRSLARVENLVDKLEAALERANGARIFFDAIRG